MDWNIEVLDQNRKRIAILDKAYHIAYTKEKDKLSTADFTLPIDDAKNRLCIPFNYIRLYENGAYIDMFRIMPLEMVKDATTSEIVYHCEHVLGKLLDTTMFKYHEVGGAGIVTKDIFNYILGFQADWVLGECDFSAQYQYSWENENLLSALYSVPGCFEEEYGFTWNTEVYPWRINLVRPSDQIKAYLRYERNMKGIRKKEDGSVVCTRLYPLGYGEGINQLGIDQINPTGLPYIDADTMEEYGVIEKIWCDRRIQNERSLFDSARAKLEKIKQPRITYEIDAAELWAMTGIEIDKFDEGDVIRIIDEEAGIDTITRIVKKSKQGIEDDYISASITVSSDGDNIASGLADLYERAKINETNSQGATNINNYSFYGNCDARYPAKLRFRIPEQAVNINRVDLSFQSDSFRAYTTAIKSGGAVNTSTNSDGSASGNTDNSGSTSGRTASDGGTNISASGGSGSGNTRRTLWENYSPSVTGGEMAIGRPSNSNVESHFHLFNGTHYHEFDVPSHRHDITVPNHRHDFDVPNHRHSFTINDHRHSFSIAAHSHEIEYGIYEGPSSSKFRVMVDGMATTMVTASDDYDIAAYLSKDDEGKIIRGWHEVLIYPDNLCRINADVMVQVFVNSRDGGNY